METSPPTTAAAAVLPETNKTSTDAETSPEYFVTIGPDGNFRDGCRTFFPAGWNQCVVLLLRGDHPGWQHP